MKMQSGGKKDDDKLLLDRLADLCARVKRDKVPVFTFFLDERRKNLADEFLRRQVGVAFSFHGGFFEAEHTMCAVYPDWGLEGAYPIALLRVTWKGPEELSHRDFLGAILSLGISRDVIGDILLQDGKAYLAATREMAGYLQDNLKTVGRCRTHTIEEGDFSHISANRTMEEGSVTAASLRLDCIVAAFLRLSRTKAQELIVAGRVNVDFKNICACDFEVKEGALLSIKGHGRYMLEEIGNRTKKGRLHLIFGKYI